MLKVYSPPDSTQARHAMAKVVKFRAKTAGLEAV
jgi:hypothetical protein